MRLHAARYLWAPFPAQVLGLPPHFVRQAHGRLQLGPSAGGAHNSCMLPAAWRPSDQRTRQPTACGAAAAAAVAVPTSALAAAASSGASSASHWTLPSFSDGWPLWTLLLTCAALGQVGPHCHTGPRPLSNCCCLRCTCSDAPTV